MHIERAIINFGTRTEVSTDTAGDFETEILVIEQGINKIQLGYDELTEIIALAKLVGVLGD